MARIARWDQPIEGGLRRAHAWANMLFVDHGIVRVLYANRAQVADKLWRSSQPTPRHIAQFAAQGGRTVVNLRGGREHGSWPLEKEACDRNGIKLVDFVLRSREAPDRDTILGTKAFLDQIEYPILVHCKSGADRAGLFCALYLLVHENRSVAEARRQLSLRFGHFRFAKTGILDAFLDAYAREGEAKGIGFAEWAETIYDPARLTQTFKPGFWSSMMADRLIRRE
jgi:protein tyrosine/serine phosphatase